MYSSSLEWKLKKNRDLHYCQLLRFHAGIIFHHYWYAKLHHENLVSFFIFDLSGWLGRVMLLGSFQCLGILLLWHMVGQGPAVLAAGAGWVGYVSFF